LVIHHAPFDLEFLDYEFSLIDPYYFFILPMRMWCPVVDTLEMARHKHMGQKNNLGALCDRYDIKPADYDLQGAILDARMLADAYLAITCSTQESYKEGVRRRTERLKERVSREKGRVDES